LKLACIAIPSLERISPMHFGLIRILFHSAALLMFVTACAHGADDSPKAGGDEARTAEVKKLVETYFRSWSNREMDAYGECFLPGASIQFISPSGELDTQSMREFLANQRRYQMARPAKETPQSIDIRFEKRLARAVVYWKLDDGSGTPKYGYDHFTLVQRDGNWRIVNLAFYESDAPR
jgi:hypothetical protein